MRFELISIGFLNWWRGLWFGKPGCKTYIFELKLVVLGAGIRIFGLAV